MFDRLTAVLFRRHGCLVAAGTAAVLLAIPDAAAHPAQQVKEASMLPVLAHKLSQSACLNMAGVSSAASADLTYAAAAEFNAALERMRHGDPARQIPPLTSRALQVAMDNLDEVWGTYGPAGQQIAAGDLTSVPMLQVLRLAEPAHDRADDVAQTVMRQQQDELPPQKAVTLYALHDLLAHMLEASKYMCLVLLDIDRDASKLALAGALPKIEAGLADVIEGNRNRGISAPQSHEAAVSLKQLAHSWASFSAPFSEPDALDAMDRADLEEVLTVSVAILSDLEEVLAQYRLQ